jgi:putative molybdopterin biosynthesis protein
LPGREVVLVNLGVWEEGLVVQAGNPRQLFGVGDLTRKGIVLVNREEGAGSRLLLDTLLDSEGVSRHAIAGYEHSVGSHQEVALAVSTGRGDAGVSTAAMAQSYGLEFVPLRRVRYDLAFLKEYVEQEPVRQLLSTLQHRWIRSQLTLLGGYDTTTTGDRVMVSSDVVAAAL